MDTSTAEATQTRTGFPVPSSVSPVAHRKLRNAGVRAELNVYEAMPHGGFGGTSPEDRELAAETRQFLDGLRR